jgi:uncharacterized membrane protein
MRKICSKCLVEKDVCEFHKHKGRNNGYCTICKICRKSILKKYYEENKDLISIRRSKKYYENHEENLLKDRERIKNERETRLERSKRYYEDNKDKVKEYKKYIEKQFEEWMTWENWGLYTWHIDHIIPLSSAKTEEEVYLLWHYRNLRPLSAQENLKKSNKIDE